MKDLLTKLREASIFKGPSKEEEVERQKDRYPKEIWDAAMAKYKSEPLALTAIAFGDAGGDIDYRDLDSHGVYTDSKTFLKQAGIVEEYNDWDVRVAEELVGHFGDRVKYRFCREGSVCTYLSPADEKALEDLENIRELLSVDEVDLRGNELRLWWD